MQKPHRSLEPTAHVEGDKRHVPAVGERAPQASSRRVGARAQPCQTIWRHAQGSYVHLASLVPVRNSTDDTAPTRVFLGQVEDLERQLARQDETHRDFTGGLHKEIQRLQHVCGGTPHRRFMWDACAPHLLLTRGALLL